ncbi:GTPase Era [Calorimonas adulescens]|uniref:GTPase Era n=1 Tax=Calorimonas adulescens TaxID=2606906 RepID=A0A5D8QBX0_9THEO|nr:GTPase Era [Calorimonas adulescens]TZE81857.1 GTPase Era [Calorimonas adulescens]
MSFKAGFVSIIGRPNVGKSTLMNCLVGEKVSIISSKPQTTRNRIMGIMNGSEYQVVFLDTPGIHKPKHKLGEYMVETAFSSLNDSDLIIYIVEPGSIIGPGDSMITNKLKEILVPLLLCINKIDIADKEQVHLTEELYKSQLPHSEIILISALNYTNIEYLKQRIIEIIPEGPRYFPEDMITDMPEQFIVAELIREKALNLLREEVPHGIAVEIEDFRREDGKNLIHINAILYCEKNSHKSIIIGKEGKMLKKIGEQARYDIERLLGEHVFLELWVKVKKKWRDNDLMLKFLGFNKS